MDYKIENIEIKTARNQSEYVLLTLVNAEDEWDEPFTVPVWNDIQIRKYKALLASPEVNGDVNMIPESKRTFKYGFWEKVTLPEPMMRLWGQTVTSTRADGTQVVHQEGTPILDKMGQPVLYTEFMVFTKRTKDSNTGELVDARGWGKVERANQMIARQFVRPTTAVATSEVPAGVIPAPIAQPAPIASAQPITTAPQAGAVVPGAPAPGVVQAPGAIPPPAVAPIVLS